MGRRPLLLFPIVLGLFSNCNLFFLQECALWPVPTLLILRTPHLALLVLVRTGHKRPIVDHFIHKRLAWRFVSDGDHVLDARLENWLRGNIVLIFQLKIICYCFSFFARGLLYEVEWVRLLARSLEEGAATDQIGLISRRQDC